MASTHTKSKAIHLGSTDLDGKVVVHDGDDKFLLTVQDAVNACGAWNKMAEFQTQMRSLMDHLAGWVKERREFVRDAYFSVKQGGGLLFMVVTRDKKFNSALEDQLTELDIDVASSDDFNLLRLSVLALPDSPKECVDSFLTNC